MLTLMRETLDFQPRVLMVSASKWVPRCLIPTLTIVTLLSSGSVEGGSDGKAEICGAYEAILDQSGQVGGCYVALRPQTTAGSAAPFVITARTHVDPTLPESAEAAGQTGRVFVDTHATGVRAPGCLGSLGISGDGTDQDEELVFVLDAPAAAGSVVLELRKIDFKEDSPVLFLSSTQAAGFDFTVLEGEIQAAFVPNGLEMGEVPFAALPSLPKGLAIDAFTIRETTGHSFLRSVRLELTCDDTSECTADACVEGLCQFEPLPAGTPCGDPSDSDCDHPDLCDGVGRCLPNLEPDGLPCVALMHCLDQEVCRDGQCGPDVCAQFEGGCETNDWSCGANWNLGGNYPSNTPMTTYSVILEDTDPVFVDVDVILDSLGLFGLTSLYVTKDGPDGNLIIETASGLNIGANLFINNSRLIQIAKGPATIGAGGHYRIEPTQTDLRLAPGAGDFEVAILTLMGGSPCPPTCPPTGGGIMELTGTMTMTVSGNFTIDGTGASPCDEVGFRGGVVPPPKFAAVDNSQATVMGDLDVIQSVDYLYASSFNMSLGGNFDNHGTVPGCFNWAEGGLTLNGSAPRTFEVAGRDLGAVHAGYFAGTDTNFSIETLEVAAGRRVTFENTFANTVGDGACNEALYVRDLILRTGANVTLSNCRIYYRSLVQETNVTVTPVGCGALSQVVSCVTDLDCADGYICSNDTCNAATGDCAHAPITALAFGDADYSGSVDVADILCVVDVFAGILSCPVERVDLNPCGGDGAVDVADILAVLDTFAGFPSCPDPCPAP